MKLRTKIALRFVEPEFIFYVENLWEQNAALRDQLAEQVRVDELQSSRLFVQMAEQFIATLDDPDQHDEVREKLSEALVDLEDQVARLEEHQL